MDTSDITIEILRGIQAGIAATNERLAEHGELFKGLDTRMRRLELHAVATNEALDKVHADIALTNQTLGVVAERLRFAEAASIAASDARVRQDERVDRFEARLEALESHKGLDQE